MRTNGQTGFSEYDQFDQRIDLLSSNHINDLGKVDQVDYFLWYKFTIIIGQVNDDQNWVHYTNNRSFQMLIPYYWRK
ncbi:ANM_collapsed_G0031830.mRNA.1.CDS.1 [Saccharomyces cerevisiae]|nr:ANM_collapsed_G0031830.mRNA.1.CDS.1 [Saccharomyces cerevisiae]